LRNSDSFLIRASAKFSQYFQAHLHKAAAAKLPRGFPLIEPESPTNIFASPALLPLPALLQNTDKFWFALLGEGRIRFLVLFPDNINLVLQLYKQMPCGGGGAAGFLPISATLN